MSNANIDRRRMELINERSELLAKLNQAGTNIIAEAHMLGNEAFVENITADYWRRMRESMQDAEKVYGRFRGVCESLRVLG